MLDNIFDYEANGNADKRNKRKLSTIVTSKSGNTEYEYSVLMRKNSDNSSTTFSSASQFFSDAFDEMNSTQVKKQAKTTNAKPAVKSKSLVYNIVEPPKLRVDEDKLRLKSCKIVTSCRLNRITQIAEVNVLNFDETFRETFNLKSYSTFPLKLLFGDQTSQESIQVVYDSLQNSRIKSLKLTLRRVTCKDFEDRLHLHCHVAIQPLFVKHDIITDSAFETTFAEWTIRFGN
jgi:hypothetical protein